MAFDFPASPAADEVFTDVASGASYTFDGVAWRKAVSIVAPPPTDVWVEEAPDDGLMYGRKSKAWSPITSNAPRPTLTSLTPINTTVGNPTTTITCTGTNFIDGVTEAYFELKPRATTFISATQVSFVIEPPVEGSGTYSVVVSNGSNLSSLPPRTFTII